VTIDALDFRVGRLVKVWNHESSEKLYCEDIDLGPVLGVRKVASGLRPFYESKDMLEGRLCVVVTNLKSRSLAGFPSHGMVLCASNGDHTSVELLDPPEGSELGERVLCEGYTKDPEPDSKVAKKKIFEQLAPEMLTNDDGVACWKGIEFRTKAGGVKAEKGMKGGHVA
jgi:tRNA-binding EMAP/Myf-like protein